MRNCDDWTHVELTSRRCRVMDGVERDALATGSKGVTKMPIENRELAPGTRLVARNKKEDRSCEVVETADGMRYRLDDGTEHRSVSSAGKAVTGGACNGWVFWSVAGDEKPKREPQTKKAHPTKKPASKRVR